MKKIDFKKYITNEDIEESRKQAIIRVEQQIDDIKKGNKRASFSNGSSGKLNTRTKQERLEDAIIGALAECVASKMTKSEWTKELGQYNGCNEADLMVNYKGEETKCHVRGSRKDGVIVRPGRDFQEEKKDDLLVGITNLIFKDKPPEIGYLTFAEIRDLCLNNKQWLKEINSSAPYYYVPSEYFNFDENDFQ